MGEDRDYEHDEDEEMEIQDTNFDDLFSEDDEDGTH